MPSGWRLKRVAPDQTSAMGFSRPGFGQGLPAPGLPQACPLALQPWSVAVRLRCLGAAPSDASFSVRRRPRFWCVFGHFARAAPLRLGVLRGGLREPFWGLPRLAVWRCSLPLWLCQSFAKAFLPDSDGPFSVRRRLRFLVLF